jgi:hypothetical protein
MYTARRRAGGSAAIMVAVLVSLGAAGCGNTATAGPTAAPDQVVTKAPDVTLAARTARVKINAPAAAAQGIVDFATRSGHLTVSDTQTTRPADLLVAAGAGFLKRAGDPGYVDIGSAVPAALRGGDPFANLDVIRGTVHILSDGGAEVDGASTIEYTLTIDPGQAISTTPPERQAAVRQVLQGRTSTFPINVWIDSKLFVRRIEVPVDLKSTTPSTRVDRMPIATDVDYLAFGEPVPAVQPPPTGQPGPTTTAP